MRTQSCLALASLLLTACPGDDSSGDTDNATDPSSTSSMSSTMSSTVSSSSSTTDTPTTDTPTTDPMTSGSTGDPMTTSGTTGIPETSESSGTTGDVLFEVTSPQFEQDGVIPSAHHSQGDNTMPELNWVGAPAGTMSFGVFFIDLDFMMGFEHSGIWNISADATGTPFDPEHVANPPDPAGSVQCRNWFNEFGYGGPGSMSNTYQFTVYALDVADLDAEIDENSSRQEV